MIQVILLGLSFYLIYHFIGDIKLRPHIIQKTKVVWGIGIGFIADFLDTLGIGSFAITTLLITLKDLLKTDRYLPGTLNVGHAVPTLVEALIFVTVIPVDLLTLTLMVLSAIFGSWVGSRKVRNFSEHKVQKWVGIALLITACLMVCKQLGWLDQLGASNTAFELRGIKLLIGCVGNFIFGMLMMIGVGLYAPCMALVYLLGLNPIAAFPIMMTSCASLMPVSGVEFIKHRDYDPSLVLGIAIGGILGVILAAQLVTHLSIYWLSWAMIVIIIYTACDYLRKSQKSARSIKKA